MTRQQWDICNRTKIEEVHDFCYLQSITSNTRIGKVNAGFGRLDDLWKTLLGT